MDEVSDSVDTLYIRRCDCEVERKFKLWLRSIRSYQPQVHASMASCIARPRID